MQKGSIVTRFLILGAGMAGLLARKAIADSVSSASVEIFSTAPPNPLAWKDLHGVHVLHDRCGLDIDEMLITNMVILPLVDEPQLLVQLGAWERKMANGTYGQKVYGSRKATTSITRMPGVIEGYDYVQAYNLLLKMFQADIKIVRPVYEDYFHKIVGDYDFVILSMPRYHVTPKWVNHPSAVVFFAPLPPVGFKIPEDVGQNVVVYNANPNDIWSRTSRIITGKTSHWTTEYNKVPPFHIAGLRQIDKVINGDVFALPESVIPVGRYGTWKSGVLAHDAYWTVIEEMRRRGISNV